MTDDDKPEIDVGRRLLDAGFTTEELRLLAERLHVSIIRSDATGSDQRVLLGEGFSAEKQAALRTALREYVGRDSPQAPQHHDDEAPPSTG